MIMLLTKVAAILIFVTSSPAAELDRSNQDMWRVSNLSLKRLQLSCNTMKRSHQLAKGYNCPSNQAVVNYLKGVSERCLQAKEEIIKAHNRAVLAQKEIKKIADKIAAEGIDSAEKNGIQLHGEEEVQKLPAKILAETKKVEKEAWNKSVKPLRQFEVDIQKFGKDAPATEDCKTAADLISKGEQQLTDKSGQMHIIRIVSQESNALASFLKAASLQEDNSFRSYADAFVKDQSFLWPAFSENPVFIKNTPVKSK
jgi:hypothetical protein